MAALQGRGRVLLFQPSAAEVHEKAGTWFDDQEIYQWFAANLYRVREPSLRHYVRARELKAAGMDWTEVLAAEAENPRARLAAELRQALEVLAAGHDTQKKGSENVIMDLVLEQIVDSVGTLTLSCPKARNALSGSLLDNLIAALERMKAAQVRAVVLRAQPGTKVFSAGHDIKELAPVGRDPLTFLDPLRRTIRAIEEHPAPVIAMIEGSVWGGACELVMSCDLLVASEDSTFAITPARLGVPYNLSGVLNLSKSVSMPLIKEMMFTAQPVTAAWAKDAGIVNYVVPANRLESVVHGLCARICQNSPTVIAILKEELRVLSEAHPLNPEAFERIQSLRRAIYNSEDYQEGIRAFAEKRPPVFEGK